MDCLAEQLAAAILQHSNGNFEELAKILSRTAPPDRLDGEMSTQTKQTRPPRLMKFINTESISEMKDLYYKNRAKTMHLITGKTSERCMVPINEVETYFKSTSKVTNTKQSDLDEMGKGTKLTVMPANFTEDFTAEEIRVVLKLAKDTAPGSDGVRYKHLADIDPTYQMLQSLYNECKSKRRIPECWKEAETVLIYKDGDRSDLSNWRPISMMSTLYKVYSSLWNNRLKKVKGTISKVQKGFSEREGCAENICILRSAIDEARANFGDLSATWLDLTNAFGSVQHELILHSLTKMGFPALFVTVIKDFYTNSTMRVSSNNELTAPITLFSGVKQGDPISPTLFNISIEYIIRNHMKSAIGHKFINTRIKLLAFADDMAIVTSSPTNLQAQLSAMDEDASKVNLVFKPRKCASLIIKQGKLWQKRAMTIRGEEIKSLGHKDSYKYLGVQLGANNRNSCAPAFKQASEDMRKLVDSKLMAHQKLDALKTFILPRITYIGSNATPLIGEVTSFSKNVMEAARSIHRIPQCGAIAYVEMPIRNGGLGVLCPKTTMMIGTIVSSAKRLWSDEPYIKKMFWDYLLAVTSRYYDDYPVITEVEAMNYLNRINNRTGQPVFSVFSRFRDAMVHLKRRIHKLELEWDPQEKELVLIIQATETSALYRMNKDNLKILHQRIKRCVEENTSLKFTTEYSTGKVTQVVMRDSRNNKFTRDGGMLSYSSHNFIHQARLDISRLNVSVIRGNNNDVTKCRRCGYDRETLSHTLNHCVYGMPLVAERHDSVLQRVAQGIREGSKKHLRLTIDRRPDRVRTRNRPDILLFDDENKHLIISDVACPFEYGESAMETSYQRKIDKYQAIADEYISQGWTAEQHPIIVGALGNWRPENDKATKALGISKPYNKLLVKVVTATVIEYSKNIYWKHIHGDNYSVAAKFIPCVTLKSARWKKITTMNLLEPEPMFTSNSEMET